MFLKFHHHVSIVIPVCTCHRPEAPKTQSSSRESEALLKECESASRRLLMPVMRLVIVSGTFKMSCRCTIEFVLSTLLLVCACVSAGVTAYIALLEMMIYPSTTKKRLLWRLIRVCFLVQIRHKLLNSLSCK